MSKSYKEIPLTFSIKEFKKTKEFIEETDRVNTLIRNKIIRRNEGDNILNSFLKDIRRYMLNKKRKNKNTLTKKIKDTEKIDEFYKGETRCTINDLEEDEKYEFEYNKVKIILPKNNYFHEALKRLLIVNDKLHLLDNEELTIYSFGSLEVVGSTTFYSYTRKVMIYNNDGIENHFENELIDMIKRMPAYENNEGTLRINTILCTLTIFKWKCIDNWWINHDEEVKYRKYKDFELFLAPNRSKNCVKQCVELLGGLWEENKSIEQMIPQKIIVNYVPINSMKYTIELSDLICDNIEDVKTSDCKNIARILKYNGHIGIITKISKFERRGKVQKQRTINVKEENALEVFMDIESFTETVDVKNRRQIPYLICWSYNTTTKVFKSIGKNCIKEFVDSLLELHTGYKEIIMYAWYGSGYDFQHILPELKKRSSSTKFTIKNNCIINGTINFDEINFSIKLKDPYLFLLTSLDKAAKAFKVLNKGSFPHSIIKDWDDLNRILPNWVKVQREIIEIKNDNKIGITIKTEEIHNYEKVINDKSILEKAIEYCEIDVIAMKEVWIKFKTLIKLHLDLEITEYMFTLSQLSMALMESMFEKYHKIYVPDKDDYMFLKDAIYGGRVIAKNGIYNEEIVYADVVSLYPSAMKLLQHSYGEPIKVKTINDKRLGIYKVTLKHINDERPLNYQEFIPRRVNGRLTWKWFKEHTGTYHTYDLLIAKEEGYEIEVHEGIEYTCKGYIFNKFIDKLYTLKEEHSNCECEEKPCPIRMIAKIALNGGGYGKFVQRPIDRDIFIVKRDIIAGECEKLISDENDKVKLGNSLINRPKFYNLDGEEFDKMVIEKDEDPVYATQQGISILSGSRYRLYTLCKQFPGLQVIYSDTDSVYIRKKSIDIDKFRKACNTELGSLDNTLENSINGIIHKMIIGGPKMYAYEYKNIENKNEIKLYCKGVPKEMLTLDHIEYLLNNSNKMIAYEFEILKRRLINIDTMRITKHIRET